MPSPNIAISPVQSPDATNTDVTQQIAQPDEKLTPQETTRSQLNASIINASIEVSIQSKNEPLALLLKSAINGINAILKPQFGDNALQAAVSQDNTPEGTAGRIVSISTGFFELFKQQHPGESEADVLKNFMSVISSGVDTGFKEARDILQGMGVLKGDIASNIDKTYALVQKGYADFAASFSVRAPLAPVAS